MVVTRSEQKLGEVFLHRDQQARRARGWKELVLEEGSGQGRAMAGEVGQADWASPGAWAQKRFAWCWIFLEAGAGLPGLQQVLTGRGHGHPGGLDEAGSCGSRRGDRQALPVSYYKVSGPVLAWRM